MVLVKGFLDPGLPPQMRFGSLEQTTINGANKSTRATSRPAQLQLMQRPTLAAVTLQRAYVKSK
jgi:hypothetical protein